MADVLQDLISRVRALDERQRRISNATICTAAVAAIVC
jgi:hypothetical protein